MHTEIHLTNISFKYTGFRLVHVRTECSDRCASDLWSLAKELLLESQSLFLHLDLLQSDLVISTHHSALWAGGQLGALLYRSTLRNPPLVHSYKDIEVITVSVLCCRLMSAN